MAGSTFLSACCVVERHAVFTCFNEWSLTKTGLGLVTREKAGRIPRRGDG